MTGGLISLALSGYKDLYLIDNPEITFFKKVYKQTSNFYIESIIQNFKQEFEFNKKLCCNISKIGDLLIDTYVYIKISNINEYIDPLTNLTNKFVKFAWAKKLGFAIINKAEIEIGGNIIETIYGDWLNIWYELTETNMKKNIDNMIGNIPEIYSFSDKKDSIELYVPLYFWFKNSNLALPLIAIKYHDININVVINNKENICNIGPNRSIEINEDIIYLENYELIEQTIDNNKNLGLFLNFDIDNKIINYIQLSNEFILPNTNTNTILVSSYNITGLTSKFTVTPKKMTLTSNNNDIAPKILSYDYDINVEKINLITTYVYLDINERIFFEKTPHTYLVNLTQYSNNTSFINKNLIFKLNFFNSCKELIWLCKLKYIKLLDIYNYTDNLVDDPNFLISHSNLYINDINVFNHNKSKFYNYIIPLYYHSNIPSIGINCYNFCLSTEDIQPTGSLNLSKITNITLALDFNKLINEEIEILIFNLSYNFIKIQNGLCSLLFIN